MKGNLVVEEKKSVVYDGEVFKFVITKKDFDTHVRMWESKGEQFARTKLQKLVQKAMKKTIDTVISGIVYEADFTKISSELVEDIREQRRIQMEGAK